MLKSTRFVQSTLGISAAVLIAFGCEKEDITGPDGIVQRPTHVSVTMDKDLILSDGRDSSLWQIQLERVVAGDTVEFNAAYTVTLQADRHGYFLSGGKKQNKITFDTDAAGQAEISFYGSREPGISTILIWGEGFGPNTVTVVVIADYPHYILLKFKDPSSGTEMDTDTLNSGQRSSQPDTTEVKVTILDRDQQPLEGVTVGLTNGSPPIGSGAFGYFDSGGVPSRGPSFGSIITDNAGVATDFYYSDVAPAIGSQEIDIVATVEPARFGSITLSKSITIIPP